VAEAVWSERVGSVLVVHLDDGKANALTTASLSAVGALLDDAEHDAGVTAVVLTGREGKFCAGFDLSVMTSGDLGRITELMSAGGDLVTRLFHLEVPVVAASTGHALAAGALLLLGCDLRLGADLPSKIGLNEVSIGVGLPTWATILAEHRLDRRHLQRSVVLAEVVDPHGAVAAGFLDEVVAPEALLATAVERAAALGAFDRAARRSAVRALRADTVRRMFDGIAEDRARVG